MPHRSHYQMADTVGDGSGTINAVGDYSSASAEFKVQCGAHEHIQCHRVIVLIEDAGPMSADDYGGISALTNGVECYVKDRAGAINYRMTDTNFPIKSNLQWSAYCHDVKEINFGSGNDAVSVRWTFAKSGGPVSLKPGWSLNFLCQDNFSGIVTHLFQVQGMVYT